MLLLLVFSFEMTAAVFDVLLLRYMISGGTTVHTTKR
jgi:hypothetical protein